MTETGVTPPIIILQRFATDQQIVILSYVAHLYSIIMDRGKAVSVNGIGWQQVVFYYHIANIVFAFGRGLFKGFKKLILSKIFTLIVSIPHMMLT